MHTYISTIFSSLSSPSASPVRNAYITSFSSPLLDLAHLDRLAKCTHNFLTPGQIKDTVLRILQVLKETWNAFWEAQQSFSANVGSGSRKKRKIEVAVTQAGTEVGDPEALAVRFALTARLSSVVLPSLPLRSLPESARQEVQQLFADFQSSFIRCVLTQVFEVVGKNTRDRRDDLWASQVAAAALLQLEYILVGAQQLKLQATRDERESDRMLEIVGDGEMLPELGLEIVCIFSFHGTSLLNI
jgi:hypothetical protein